uniref:Uncharacterized protein n=1 Tax=Strigamia maritima TaxID=126957 RepID=T1JG83_STRMM
MIMNMLKGLRMSICIFILASLAFQGIAADDAVCSPWLGYCQVSDHCCRYLICSSYTAKCVPKSYGILDPADKRPIGPGPWFWKKE